MERSEYLKKYRTQNKDKIKKYNEKYYDKKRKLKIINTDETDNTNDKKINQEINKIPNLNFGERMKLIREKKKDEFIKKMKENGNITDDSDDSDDAEKSEENNKNENSDNEKNEINFKKISFDEDNEKNENILSVKDLIYEIHNLNDEIDGLRDILNSTEILLKNSNTQNIELSKEIKTLRLELKKYDLFNKNNDADD